jgi:hypothetical protein
MYHNGKVDHTWKGVVNEELALSSAGAIRSAPLSFVAGNDPSENDYMHVTCTTNQVLLLGQGPPPRGSCTPCGALLYLNHT